MFIQFNVRFIVFCGPLIEYVTVLFSYFMLKYIVSYLAGSTLTLQNNVKGVKQNSKTEDKKQQKLERTENLFILFHIFFLFLLDIQRETNCNVLEVFVMSSSITSHLLLTSFSQKKDELCRALLLSYSR